MRKQPPYTDNEVLRKRIKQLHNKLRSKNLDEIERRTYKEHIEYLKTRIVKGVK